MPKNECKFNVALPKEFPIAKLKRGTESEDLCAICDGSFKYASRADVIAHNITARHLKATQTVRNKQMVHNMFIINESMDLKAKAKELAFAYHAGRHRMSGCTADCNSKLINKCFDSKFNSGETKTAKIIRNVISPEIERDVAKALENLKFVTLITDTSYRKSSEKMLPVLVRGFDVDEGVKVFKLAVNLMANDERSQTVANKLIGTAERWKVDDKIIAFASDNCATNFGGDNRNGENNVFFHLKQMLGREIVGVGWSCHMIHNAYDAACDQIPIDIEAFVVAIYKHIYIHTLRVESLKAICDDQEVTYTKLARDTGTRFSTLLPAIKKITLMFAPLKEYFDKVDNCPSTIHEFFNQDDALFWLNFMESQLKSSNDHVLKTEGKKIASFEVATEISILRMKIENRKNAHFIPHAAKLLLKTFNETEKDYIKHYVEKFYTALSDYLEKWSNSLDGTEVFCWMDLATVPEWTKNVKPSIEYFSKYFHSEIIDNDTAFDETNVLCQIVQENLIEWNVKKVTSEKRWLEVFAAQRRPINNLSLLVQYAFAIPGSSTDVERLFSIINDVWRPDRGQMNMITLEALLNIKVNSNIECSDYFDSIKDNRSLLQKYRDDNQFSASSSQPIQELESEDE